MKVMDISQSSQQNTESQRRFLAKWVLPVLFVFLGISSWMSVNLIWVEMPLLVSILPEQWNLASYVSVLIQFGNIGPLLCVFIKKKSQYAALIYLIISWLIATHFILSFVYDITTEIGNNSYSVAFFIEVFFMALCDCTSNVTYLPYMASFNPRYLVFFFIGQGLAGLIPSILALVQGSGSYTCEWHNSTSNGSNISSLQPVFQPSRFSFSVFLYVTTSLLVLSLCAYICIDFILKKLKKQAIEERQAPYVVPDAINGHVTAISDIIDLPQLDPFRNENVTVSNSNVQGRNSEEITESTPVVAGRAVTQPTVYDALDTRPANSVFQDGEHQSKPKKLPFVRKQYEPKDFVFEYLLAAVFCFFLNGFMPGFQTYSAVPYGQLSYTLCACLAVASVPCASWLTMLIKAEKSWVITLLGALATIPMAYIIAMAALCPDVLLNGNIFGNILIVCSWVLYQGTFTYGRVCLAMRVQNGGHKALFWFGLTSQAASLIGAVSTFLMVSTFQVFREPIRC